MKRKCFILCCIVLILLVSTGISLIGCKVENDVFSIICQIPVFVSAITGIATLVIAIHAYKTFIDNRIISKNVEAVIKVIDEIQKLGFQIKGKNFFLFIRLNDKDFAKRYQGHEKESIYFSREAFGRIVDFVLTCKSPFLPQSISSSLERVAPSYGILKEAANGVAVVEVIGANSTEVMDYNGKVLTVKEFLDMFNDVSQAILKWMGSNATNKIDLTF